MRYFLVKITAIAALATLSIGSANAVTMTATYTVIGSNFTSTGGPPPFASITESFTVTFNNAVSVSQQTAGISLNASTITPTSTLAYTYNSFLDSLVVGGIAMTVTNSDTASTDFAIIINSASKGANFSISSLTYSVGQGAVYTAGTTAKPAAVPEPASLALLGTAAAMLGLIRRRR